MGADHQRGLAAGDFGQHLAAGLGLLAAGEPGHAFAQGREQRLQPAHQLAEMLVGQDLGGRHQRALPAGIHRNAGGQGRHHGLARSHVALQQAVHGYGQSQVGGDLHAHALLRPGQPEWQRGQQVLL